MLLSHFVHVKRIGLCDNELRRVGMVARRDHACQAATSHLLVG